MFRFYLSADYRKLWSQLWTGKATVCSLGHIGICEYPQRREQSLVNEFVFTVITMFFFHFSFSGIRNDSSNDLLMAWEQTASGHPCIVFFNWVSSTVIHVYKSIFTWFSSSALAYVQRLAWHWCQIQRNSSEHVSHVHCHWHYKTQHFIVLTN